MAQETDGCTAELHVLGTASDTQKVKVTMGPVNALVSHKKNGRVQRSDKGDATRRV